MSIVCPSCKVAFRNVAAGEECERCGHVLPELAAADAVPGPEVEWSSEPGTEVGRWYWTLCSDVLVPLRSSGHEVSSEYIQWWPVPISEPPVTKGEGE